MPSQQCLANCIPAWSQKTRPPPGQRLGHGWSAWRGWSGQSEESQETEVHLLAGCPADAQRVASRAEMPRPQLRNGFSLPLSFPPRGARV